MVKVVPLPSSLSTSIVPWCFLMIPWLMAAGLAGLNTQRLGTHAMRNAFLYAGNVAWYYGVTLVPLAELAALQFTMPIFTVIMAGIVLRETIGLHRALVVGIGFAGTLIIVRPGAVDIGAGPFCVLAAGGPLREPIIIGIF